MDFLLFLVCNESNFLINNIENFYYNSTNQDILKILRFYKRYSEDDFFYISSTLINKFVFYKDLNINAHTLLSFNNKYIFDS